MSESKSLLARLLAKENISVHHGNYTTAYFDVQNRVLGLPLWKDDDKDLYDMLVGHEVGHALYTPAEGWMGTQSKENDDRVPGDYLNVVEDIRIERKIQEMYPGIVRSFKKGYSYLNSSDFFGLKGRDHNRMGLMDRINLKAKLRDLIDVEFSAVEQPLVDRAFAADTWDEVVESARELYLFLKSNPDSQDQTQNEESASSEDQSSSQDSQEESMIDPTNGSSDETEESSEDGDANDSKDSQDGESDTSKDSADTSNRGSGEADENSDSTQDQEGGRELEEVETYRQAQENAADLLEKNQDGDVPLVIHGMSRSQMYDMIVPFHKVRDARYAEYDREINRLDRICKNPDYLYADDEWKNKKIEEMSTENAYKEFLTETKRVVNVMAKEFELRKAAYQYSRSSTARSGALDLQRLHEYKTSDDIFSRVTTLADAKSHGMVMLVDNSASMQDARGPVITQVLNLAMFCKRVNIPFDVYSFTNRHADDNYISGLHLTDEQLLHQNTMLTHVLSSSFNRRDYDVAYRQLFDISRSRFSCGEYDKMSGTPLNDILTGMHILLNDFRKKHQIQKTIFTVLSDGDSNTLSVSRDVIINNTAKRRNGVRLLMSESRRKVKIRGYNPSLVTGSILKAVSDEVPGLTTVGYFVANNSNDFRTAVYRAEGVADNDVLRDARKIANRDKFVSYDDTLGYDRFFVLKAARAKDLEAIDDEFTVSDKAKRADITRAFKKYAKSKKGNRVMATQFAEIIS